MGFFDLFTGGSIEKQIEKHAKRIKKKDAQQEDRVAERLLAVGGGILQRRLWSPGTL